jgi:hypothetical protein
MKHVLGIAILLAAAGAGAEPAHYTASYTEDQVKRHYLNCDMVSSRRMLDPSESTHCSSVADRLLKHHFAGDLNALLAWWQGEKASYRAAVEMRRQQASAAP